MGERELDALLVYAAPVDLGSQGRTSGNIRYLTGWADRNQPSLLVLPATEEPALLVAQKTRQRWAQRKDLPISDVRNAGSAGALGVAAREVLSDRGVSTGRIGIIGKAEMMVPAYQGLMSQPSPWEFTDADDLLARLRLVKDPEEITLHRMAAKISDTMLHALMNGGRVPGKWAWQLLAEMEFAGRSLGADYASGWVGTGRAPEMPGYHLWQNRRQIETGDRVEAGTNVVYEGYWAHGLRMGVKGKVAPELRRHFEAIVEAQEAGARALKPGALLRDVASIVDAAIDTIIGWHSSYVEDEHARGRAGHALGLSYLDPLASDAFERGNHSTVLVQAGMVLELHPNFSVPGLGFICIGDTVLVTESGVEFLTQFPRGIYDI